MAIAAGGNHSLALKSDGRIVGWGNDDGAIVPSGLSNVVAIAAGSQHSLALTREGRVVAWGDNSSGQTDVPSGLSNVVAIAAGGGHNLALTAAGEVAAWGENWDGQTNVPSGLSNVVAIAAGNAHSLALTNPPPAWFGPRFLLAMEGLPFQHRIIAGTDTLAYAASGLPAGLVLDPNTGLFTGQPALAVMPFGVVWESSYRRCSMSLRSY